MEISEQDIGGGRVRRTFTSGVDAEGGPNYLRPGSHLTGDEVRAIQRPNRRALVDAGYLEVYPRSNSSIEGLPTERFIVAAGKNSFDVIEGCKLNDTPLSRSQADEMASS